MTPAGAEAIDPDLVETPIGCVDLARAAANARRVAAYADEHGLGWRPHVKTHKSIEVARLQISAGARGLTVATLREAEVMAGVTDDLLLAYPPVGPAKLARLVSLPQTLSLKVALDDAEVLNGLAAASRSAERRPIGVLIEQDVGLGRVGRQTADEVVALARRAAEQGGVEFLGLMFYPGHIRMARKDQDAHLVDLTRRVGSTLEALDRAGLPAAIVSGGSTPTLWRSHEVSGLTEIRSGSCIYNDREALDVGVAGRDDLAYTVLATVVSTAVPGHAVVDAGSKALAKEARGGGGFGVLLDHPEVQVVGLSEEHGVLDVSATSWRPRIGERVRIVPNHVCVSVNLQDHVVAFDGETHRLMSLEGRGRTPWTA